MDFAYHNEDIMLTKYLMMYAIYMFSRYLRRLSIDIKFKTINEWTFDVFSVNEFTNGQCLRYVGFELMQRYNLTNKLHISITALHNFLEQMESGYSKYRNPYHNLVHAADVLQTTYQIIYNSGLMVEVNGV
jgi:calcium/calmodulin-dependent 3',5'-cyclic nucleotide phosphodiesterase